MVEVIVIEVIVIVVMLLVLNIAAWRWVVDTSDDITSSE